MNLKHDDIPFDADEKLLDQQLRQSLPVRPPVDLTDRIFAATVHAMRDQSGGVIGRISGHVSGHVPGAGWTQWSGWRYAAAIGLVFFYAALWARPHPVPTRISEIELARADKFIVDPQSHLDTCITSVAEQLDAISHRLAVTATVGTNSTNTHTLAHDLYLFENGSF
ncbi:MAG: hypothetical protein ACYC26_08140 [Phycisphaerales bacterium]